MAAHGEGQRDGACERRTGDMSPYHPVSVVRAALDGCILDGRRLEVTPAHPVTSGRTAAEEDEGAYGDCEGVAVTSGEASSADHTHSSTNSPTSSGGGECLFLSPVSSTIVPRWNYLSPFSGALKRERLLACCSVCGHVLAISALRGRCGRIHPPGTVFTPRMPFPLSVSLEAVDVINPSTVREKKEIACSFEGRILGFGFVRAE